MFCIGRFKFRRFTTSSFLKNSSKNINFGGDFIEKKLNRNDRPVIGEEFQPHSNTKMGVGFEKKVWVPPLTIEQPVQPVVNVEPPAAVEEPNKGESASLRMNFDSSHYVNMLKAEGFTDAEANGLIALVSEVVEESMVSTTKSLVSKSEKKRFLDACLNELKLIKTDVSNLELRDFANLKKTLETIKQEVENSKTNLVSDLARIRAGARLDMNLEKSRIQMEAVDLKAQLKIAEDKIDRQIDKLEARMDAIRKSTKVGTQRFLFSVLVLMVSIRFVILYQGA